MLDVIPVDHVINATLAAMVATAGCLPAGSDGASGHAAAANGGAHGVASAGANGLGAAASASGAGHSSSAAHRAAGAGANGSTHGSSTARSGSGQPAVYHCATSAANPLMHTLLAQAVHDHFVQAPFLDKRVRCGNAYNMTLRPGVLV